MKPPSPLSLVAKSLLLPFKLQSHYGWMYSVLNRESTLHGKPIPWITYPALSILETLSTKP